MLSVVLALILSVPAQWTSCDTHVHLQTCDGSVVDPAAQASAAGLDFAALQAWSVFGDIPGYQLYAPLVGSYYSPSVRWGVEVSGFPASKFGHLNILGAHDGSFPIYSEDTGPILEYYDDALCGYAHTIWTESYDPVMFLVGAGPYLAPVDAALGLIDFIEACDVEQTTLSWEGLYYKLQSAGIDIGLVAGSDDSCYSSDGVGRPCTWAVGSTFDEWCEGVRTGPTSISVDPTQRLDLTVDGTSVTVDKPSTILVGGNEVGFISPSGTLQLNIMSSTWVAAKSPGMHTSAHRIIIDDEPIASLADAAYWVSYCDNLLAALPSFNLSQAAAASVAGRIAKARAIYAALAARASPSPSNVVEYGESSTYGEPISIGSDAGVTYFDCLGAKAGAPGYLVLGTAAASMNVSGATLLVSLSGPHAIVPVQAGLGGYCKVPVTLPSGIPVFAQFVWLGPMAMSDGLQVTRP